MNTIDYYENHSQAFYMRTITVDVTDRYQKVRKYLPEKADILDAGMSFNDPENHESDPNDVPVGKLL